MAEVRWFDALDEILGRSHLWPPDDLAGTVDTAMARLGLRTTIWLVDHQQVALRALPQPGRAIPAPVPIAGTLPGRVFARVTTLPGDPDRWWAASCERAVVSAVLQPCYDVGGDGFDYTLDAERAHLMILDAAGRGLSAGLACSVALAAVRAARRAGHGLLDQARAADAALLEQFTDARFVTAVLAALDFESGRLRYLNAGHPAPLVLRDGKPVRQLDSGRRLPLGLDDPGIELAEVMLEPGDQLLLYTDGVTEARTGAGERFGLDRLVDLVERHAGSGLPAPEVLRRLAHAVVDRQGGPPDDDATLLLLQWSGAAATSTVPGTERDS